MDQVATCKENVSKWCRGYDSSEIMMKNIDKNMFEFEKVNIDNQPLIRFKVTTPQVESFVTLMLNFIQSLDNVIKKE